MVGDKKGIKKEPKLFVMILAKTLQRYVIRVNNLG